MTGHGVGDDRRYATITAVAVPLLTPAEHLDRLRADVDRVLTLPPDQLDARVGACPDWSVAELIDHVSGVFRFATTQLRAEPGAGLQPFDPPGDDGTDGLDRFAAEARRLLEALENTDPGEHRPNWADAPTAAFWFRRMAHELAVHRWDAQAAIGPAEPIEPLQALDGVEELCDVFLPFAGRRGITGNGETVHLHATDLDTVETSLDLTGAGEWTVRFHAAGVDVDRGHAKGDMAVRGSASDLMLFAWNRRPIVVETFGAPDPVEFWRATVRI